MATGTYDPKKVVVTFAGVQLTGFADGTFVSAERNEDAFTETAGADGEVARVRSNNKTGRVTFTLMQTSPANDVLSALLAQDELQGSGISSLQIKDLRGTTVLNASEAWIVKHPKVEFGKELSNREWVVACSQLEGNVGGYKA